MVVTRSKEIKALKEYAREEKVPIMQDEGIEFLKTNIIKNEVNTVLEIGSAIGYSAIMMALTRPNLKVVSIERDHLRYMEAIKNVKAFELEDRITLIHNDALLVDLEEKFDLIFIDAAKGKNRDFFEKFSKNLNKDGIIITDNINFHGFVKMNEEEIKSKNLRSLVKKIKEYIEFLKNNQEYQTDFFDVGDGVAVSKRVNN